VGANQKPTFHGNCWVIYELDFSVAVDTTMDYEFMHMLGNIWIFKLCSKPVKRNGRHMQLTKNFSCSVTFLLRKLPCSE